MSEHPSRKADELHLTREDFVDAYRHVAPFVHRTPLLTSRTLSERTGFDVRLKAELFQKGGSYKVRGPMNKIARLTKEERSRGVICSSAGNHSQGVALAARHYGVKAVVCMAENATPSKIAATEGYGARVVLHGTIWDEANEKALELVESEGYTYVHPFDDPDLIAGQGTVGLEILEDFPEVDVLVVPIGGGGLISGVSMAAKAFKPGVRVIGVESSGAPAMKLSVEAGHRIVLDEVDCIIDGLRVKRVGEKHPFGRFSLCGRDRHPSRRKDVRGCGLADGQGQAGGGRCGGRARGGFAERHGGGPDGQQGGMRSQRWESGRGPARRPSLELKTPPRLSTSRTPRLRATRP